MGVRDRAFRLFVRAATWFLRRIVCGYFDVSVHGMQHLPMRGPAIIAGNHPSAIDGLLLYLTCPAPLRFIAHRELFRHPLTGGIVRGMGFINAGLHGQALHAAQEAVERGEIVVIFPEGGPYEQGRMEVMQHGVGILALKCRSQVVPLGIAGAQDAFPLGAYLPRPGRIALALGPPVTYPEASADPVPTSELVGVMVDIRQKILDTEQLAAGYIRVPRPRRRGRLATVLVSAVFLVPIVFVVTILSTQDVDTRPEPE